MSNTNQTSRILLNLVLIGIIYLGTNNPLMAQGEFNKINAYASVGAVPGLEALMNIEVLVNDGGYFTWYGRGGLGYGGILLNQGGPGVLAAMTMLSGRKNHHIEVNGGAFLGYDNNYGRTFILPSLDFGYRFQKPSGGFLFKIKTGILGFGIGLGYAF
ncbi:hypothetical protein [uncultured Cyclobacterium sp.]|uniref:hypothetical protein n=1 Tax=uncultured Cyclobacterium sp. TaxID=453820 RepID=UPI0030EC6432|tara:strand:+ start:120731 stop:121204 length:474 start_codon:yes stop_codon:yes gene_type:complete